MMEMDFLSKGRVDAHRFTCKKQRRHLPICFNYCTKRAERNKLSLDFPSAFLWINNFFLCRSISQADNVII